MRKNIKATYRECLKQTNKLKAKDPCIHRHLIDLFHALRHTTGQHQAIDKLNGLTNLISKCLQNDQKSILKLVRVLTGNSMLVTNTLQFRPDYETKAIEFLKKDIEYQSLTLKDRQFVEHVIKMVCDHKPTYKFKTVGAFLSAQSSEKQEALIRAQRKQKVFNRQYKQWQEGTEWRWAYEHFFEQGKQHKIQIVFKQMLSKRMLLL